MDIFLSTTSLGLGRTNLLELFDSFTKFDIEGIEFGSNHQWTFNLISDLKKRSPFERAFSHNYFPPEPNNIVLNIASLNKGVRESSIAHAIKCIDVAKLLGCEFYTLHPGFLSENAIPADLLSGETGYDFRFIGRFADYDSAFTEMVASLKKISSYARQSGVGFAIETEGSVTSSGHLLMETPEEFKRLRQELGDLCPKINFNFAHSVLASKKHGFGLKDFISDFGKDFIAIEVSDNDGKRDLHKYLTQDSYILSWLRYLPKVPIILEFRAATILQIENSIKLLRGKSDEFSSEWKKVK